MSSLLLVALGGAIGSAARYLVSSWAQEPHATFPIGTLAVNVIGCLGVGVLLGVMAGRPQAVSADTRLFIVAGIAGGFTTFSAFSAETWMLAQADAAGLAALNIAAQVIGGLLAFWAGAALARAF